MSEDSFHKMWTAWNSVETSNDKKESVDFQNPRISTEDSENPQNSTLDDIIMEILKIKNIKNKTASKIILKEIKEAVEQGRLITYDEIKYKHPEINESTLRKAKNELFEKKLIAATVGKNIYTLTEDFKNLFEIAKKNLIKKLEQIAQEEEEVLLTEEKIEKFLKKEYMREIDKLGYVGGEYSLTVDFFKLMLFDESLAQEFLEHPEDMLNLAEQVLNKILASYPNYKRKVNFRIENLPDVRKKPVRALRAEDIDELWSIEGVVRRITDVRPRLTVLIYECVHCGNRITVEVEGDKIQKPAICPSCERKGPFDLILKESRLVDFQKLVLQEPHEGLRAGEQPRQIAVYLEDDLVDSAMPGNRVEIVGIPKAVIDKNNVNLKIYFKAISIKPIEVEFEEIEIKPEDEKKIKELASQENLFELLRNSIAPHIYGHDEIKEAIILQLFGAPAVELEDARIRGDIHILLIGEPSTGKSELLKSVRRIAPRSVFTTGSGSSGVGLTAAVIREEGEGFILEAGALPLADKGICIIDEFEKAGKDDLLNLHEAMEQQTVSIAKAGIVANLVSRCAVLAAANPKYGRFDNNRSLAEQINIPPTILSRFDLIFFVRDDLSQTEALTDHILRTFKKPEDIKPSIDPELLRKYIAYAKQNIKPRLTEEAEEVIKQFFVGLRNKAMNSEDSPIPITARQLIGIIRLAMASARARLSEEVTKEDAERAIRLVKTSLMQAGVDPDTGKIDIDKIMVGVTKSQREKIQILREIIEEYDKEDEILREAANRGIDYEDALKLLEIMVRNGEVLYINGRYKLREGVDV